MQIDKMPKMLQETVVALNRVMDLWEVFLLTSGRVGSGPWSLRTRVKHLPLP